MSKKILKRSLALGALMAFVITGSAFAAETLTANRTVDGIVYTDFDGWYDPSGVGTGESGEKEWNLNGNTLTVNKCTDANRAIYVEGFNITGNENMVYLHLNLPRLLKDVPELLLNLQQLPSLPLS